MLGHGAAPDLRRQVVVGEGDEVWGGERGASPPAFATHTHTRALVFTQSVCTIMRLRWETWPCSKGG